QPQQHKHVLSCEFEHPETRFSLCPFPKQASAIQRQPSIDLDAKPTGVTIANCLCHFDLRPSQTPTCTFGTNDATWWHQSSRVVPNSSRQTFVIQAKPHFGVKWCRSTS